MWPPNWRSVNPDCEEQAGAGTAPTAEEVLAWNDATARSWRRLAEDRPEVLLVPCDIYGVSTVGELLRHIVAVETR